MKAETPQGVTVNLYQPLSDSIYWRCYGGACTLPHMVADGGASRSRVRACVIWLKDGRRARLGQFIRIRMSTGQLQSLRSTSRPHNNRASFGFIAVP